MKLIFFLNKLINAKKKIINLLIIRVSSFKKNIINARIEKFSIWLDGTSQIIGRDIDLSR